MTAPIRAQQMVADLTAAGFGPFIGVPCSHLAPIITWCERHDPERYLAANNEGEAVSIGAGAVLAGRSPVVMMQNSGLGNAVNPITSLCAPMKVPMLLLVTWRGMPGRTDEPQHHLMGAITLELLDLMDVRHEVLGALGRSFADAVVTAREVMAATGQIYAIVVPPDSVAPEPTSPEPPTARSTVHRRDVIREVVGALDDNVVVVATTGKTARELEAGHDRPGNLYVVGSMGCASSIGLGIALEHPDRPVVVLDGDGAALMRLEAMVSIGVRRPSNLVHVIIDNGTYESTGAQQTLSGQVDLAAVATACGYRSTGETQDGPTTAAEVAAAVAGGTGPVLIRSRVATGSWPNLGRPRLSPEQVAKRLHTTLALPRA